PHHMCFFFQAEDGIRDKLVTGVQTCALPIFADSAAARARAGYVSPPSAEMRRAMRTAEGPILPTRMLRRSPLVDVWSGVTRITEIGRASCRKECRARWGP